MKNTIIIFAILFAYNFNFALSYNDYSKAMQSTTLEAITQKAQDGDVSNQELLVFHYELKSDYDTAIAWAMKAQENGSGAAMYSIYSMHKYKQYPVDK